MLPTPFDDLDRNLYACGCPWARILSIWGLARHYAKHHLSRPIESLTDSTTSCGVINCSHGGNLSICSPWLWTNITGLSSLYVFANCSCISGSATYTKCFNTLATRQIGRYFIGNIFNVFPKGPINNTPALVHVMMISFIDTYAIIC